MATKNNSNFWWAALLLMTVAVSGCNSASKLAQRCAELYPLSDTTIVRERIVTDTLVLGGYDVVYTDTVDCPASAVATRVIDTVRYSLPARLIFTERLVRDTTVIRSPTALARAMKCPTCATNCARPRWLPVWADRLVYGLLGMIAGVALLGWILSRRL